MYYTYILQSAKDKQFYTGFTKDLKLRFEQHNKGMIESTKNRRPFDLIYLIYLNRFSQFLMAFYLNMAIQMCKMTGTHPSFLLHPLDLIGGDLVRELSFFPGMDVETAKKTNVFKKVINFLSNHFQLVNMSKNARHLLGNGNLKVKICK